MRPIRPKISESSVDGGQHSIYNPHFLRQRARWIRDDLDPQVARDGYDALHADDVLKLDDFLRQLLASNISLEDIRSSRVHIAVLEISGRGTRWPKRLIERSDALKAAWEGVHGSLQSMGFPLYEPGGRLYQICKPDDLNKEKLVAQWLKAPGALKLSPVKALRSGDVGFKPGDWWINPLFAFREGIINSGEAESGIVADAAGAYAVVMTGNSEESCDRPDKIVYRARSSDKGRYRLTAGTPESRHPVRILRSHTLRSFWAPEAGLRYDGLYKVTGWTIKMDAKDEKKKKMLYLISFMRLPNQVSIDEVLRRPRREEIEDYQEYKRLHELARFKQAAQAVSAQESTNPFIAASIDGGVDSHGYGSFWGAWADEEELISSARRNALSSRDTAGLGPSGVATTAYTLQNDAGTRADSVAH
ncbi:hypothetical protein LTR56_015372 [Elasticomyces elasticus]|nr:hypothetical protein LTR56_015372 [Elasticomyces elasticus]KAK3637502.1 hypothetical protein LTR22_018225 [Elasticomyces elasticus]KAK4911465.1 hypothetical protein LTR49_019960 [Elasticomyces elasticus]KAK5768064.1 hypothetical protein LTS12_001881 [Elasticomyces elasticus]